MTYDVDYFIDKFSNIPEENWCTRALLLYDGVVEKRCAIGHCFPDGWNVEMMGSGVKYPENVAMTRILPNRMDINNGDDLRYQQPTPKQRILAALRDVKAAQEKENPKSEIVPEVKERIVYVAVDEKVRELSKTELSQQ